MKAARLRMVGEQLHLEQIAQPTPGPEEVLVKVRASGICHSDLNYRDGIGIIGRLPITLGHEISGIVENVGEHAAQISIGDRVVIHYVVSCGQCRFCKSDRETYCAGYAMIGKDLDGGFAEYIKVPARNALRIPESLPFDQAAIMGCAVSTALHALRRGRAKRDDAVVIYGVGGLGAHATQLASAVFHASNIIAVDIDDDKLALARRSGATNVVNAAKQDLLESISKMTDGVGPDLVIDFVGRRTTIQNAIACAGKGARIVVVGISPDELPVSPYSTVIGKEIELIGVNDHLKSELEELIQLVSSGTINLSQSITHRVSLDEVNRGMEILEEQIGKPLRVVVDQ